MLNSMTDSSFSLSWSHQQHWPQCITSSSRLCLLYLASGWLPLLYLACHTDVGFPPTSLVSSFPFLPLLCRFSTPQGPAHRPSNSSLPSPAAWQCLHLHVSWSPEMQHIWNGTPDFQTQTPCRQLVNWQHLHSSRWFQPKLLESSLITLFPSHCIYNWSESPVWSNFKIYPKPNDHCSSLSLILLWFQLP